LLYDLYACQPAPGPRDAAVLLVIRVTRLFIAGAVFVVLVLFLAAAAVDASRIGLLLTLTLAGDAALSLWLATRADRLGRRRIAMAGALLLAGAGVVFAVADRFLCLAVAATAGILSPNG
jgi:MFS family permease